MKSINKKISVITVTLNAVEALAETLNSVTNQNHFELIEFIVIDGGSVDESLTLLEKYKDKIDILISSKDRGVYDAMNKGVEVATGEWLYFLNAGDIFSNDNSLTAIFAELADNDMVYSDVRVDDGAAISIFNTSFDDRVINHQGVVYRKTLHERFGIYAVVKGFTAADYFFFLQLDNLKVKKLNEPIATFKAGGLSSTVKAVRQKYCLDFLSGRISALSLAFRLVVYPLYRLTRRVFS